MYSALAGLMTPATLSATTGAGAAACDAPATIERTSDSSRAMDMAVRAVNSP